MADGEAEARFSHLLQPIRDLARNWDIDIASSLEDYLEELDQLKISLDGGEANLNFAEAALLIQGTACIYSRKVEYLHSLVFQVLDRLAGSQGQQGGGKGRRGAGAGQGDGDGKDDDDDHALLGGAGDPFPLLDSLLEEGRGEIDLKPQLVLESLKAAANPNGGAGKGGSKGPAPHCRPPLLVMEECNASFKVATCSVHKSGALLMEESLRRELEPALAAEKGKRRPSYGMVYDGDRQVVGEEEDDAMGGADAAWGAGGGGDDYHHDDDDFRMDDDGGPPAGFEEAPMPMEEEGAAVAGTVAVPQGQEEPGQGRELRSRHKQQQQQEAEQQEEEDEDDEEFEDPWAALDPHDPGKAPPRPFRKGKMPKAPPMPKAGTPTSTSEPSAASVASAAFLSLTGLTFGEFAPIAKALEAAAKRRTRVRRAQQQPRQPEDDRRASGRRRSMALYAAVTAPAPLAEGRVAEAAALAAGSGSGAAGGAADDLEEDDDDDMIGAADAAWMGGGGGDDFQHGGDDDFRMDDDGHWGGGGGGGMEQEAWHEGEGAAAAALGGAFGEEGGSGGRRRSYAPVSLEDGGLLDDAFAGAAQSYEALCRKHMDAFMRGLEAYAHETQLTRRVADWQDKVEPMLEVQERRTPFDIHDCGDEILTTLAKEELEKEGQENAGGAKGNAAMEEAEAAAAAGKKKGKGAARESVDGGAGANQERSFQEIVSGKEQYEVCRLFLASLQLANNGNVQLVHEAGPQDKDGLSFRLNLLSDQRMHERFTGTELGDIETAH